MAAIAHLLDEVVLTGSSAEGPVQAWDVRTGMQLKAYKCVRANSLWCPTHFFFFIFYFFFTHSLTERLPPPARTARALTRATLYVSTQH